VYGRRPTIAVSMCAAAGSYALLGAAPTPYWVLGAAALAGVCTDAYRPAVGALVADIVAPEDRARAFALFYWAINLGVGCAAVLGGHLAARGYWLLLLGNSVVCIAFAALILTVREPRRESAPSDGSDAASGWRPALRDPRLVRLTVATTAYAVVLMQGFTTLPVAMAREGLDSKDYGVVAAFNPLTILVLQPLLARVLPRLGSPAWLFAVGAVLTGLGFGATGFAHATPAFAATVVLWTLGELAVNSTAPALLAAIAPSHLRGRYQGIWSSSWSAGLLVGPATGLWLLGGAGDAILWGGCLACCLLSATIVLYPTALAAPEQEPAQ
jgi:MFS family permease